MYRDNLFLIPANVFNSNHICLVYLFYTINNKNFQAVGMLALIKYANDSLEHVSRSYKPSWRDICCF